MRHLSLSEVLEIHRAEGRQSMGFQPRAGEFEVGIYGGINPAKAASDPDAWKSGRRESLEIKPNLVTRALSEYVQSHVVIPAYLFIASDEKPTDVLKTDYRSTWNETGGAVIAATWDTDVAARLWTVTATILAPAVGRVRSFRTVGVSRSGYVLQGNSVGITNAWAATLLSSKRTQDESQQVVISYRLAWEEGRNV